MGGASVGNTSNGTGGMLKIFEPIGNFVGVSPLMALIISATALIVLIVGIIAIVLCVKKSKKAKRAMNPVVVEEEPKQEKIEEVKQEAVVATAEKAEEIIVQKEENIAMPQKKEAPKQAKKFYGKWIIEHKSDDEYMAKLSASNGEVMLSSEIYKSEDGAVNGIATIVKGIDTGNFVIYQDKNKNYYYKLKTANNKLLCVGEIYKSKDQCLKAVESVKRIAKLCEIDEDVISGSEYVDYTPAKLTEADIKNSAKGKWKIETVGDGKFTARLYANNGQLMLATEEVQIRKNAENAIESVKKNSLQGHFVIDRDKFGRYYYKLRNAQKSVICIGEAYDSLDSCKSAIESVRRFASNSDLV